MTKKIAQKCSEGNIETSEQNEKEIFKSRKFVITYWCEEQPLFTEYMTYLAYAAEVCPKTERKHWQAFCYCKNQHSEAALAKHLKRESSHGTDTHVEYMRGDFRSNKDYCSKEGRLIEHGHRPTQGERVDLDDLKEAIVTNKRTVNDICMDDPYLYHKYGRTMQKMEDISNCKKRRTEMTEGIYIWGPAGTGKSFFAANIAVGIPYEWSPNHGYFDTYNGEHTAIFDDIEPGMISFYMIKKLVDWTQYSVEQKNKPCYPFVSKRVIICSTYPPEQLWHEDYWKTDWIQFTRRFQVIHHTEIGQEHFVLPLDKELLEYKGFIDSEVV